MAVLSVTVEAIKIPGSWGNLPLRAELLAPSGEARLASVALDRGDENGGTGFRIEWLEPVFAAEGKSVYRAVVRPATSGVPETKFAFAEEQDGLLCTENGRPVVKYMAAFDPENLEETKKPYHHVWDPSGRTLLTKGSGGKYPHHRGIFVGWKETKVGGRTWDTWHMPDGSNSQRLLEVHTEAALGLARILSRVYWYDPDGKVYISESRNLTARTALEEGRVLDVGSVLRCADGVTEPIELGGDLQHAGLQFRAADQVASETEKLTEFIFPAPEGPPSTYMRLKYPDESIMGKDPRWGCMLFTVRGGRYGVLYMSHPETKRPAEFSIRHYGRFGEFFPFTLRPSQPLVMKYRFFVFDGEHDPKYLEAVYQGYMKPPRVSVARLEWR